MFVIYYLNVFIFYGSSPLWQLMEVWIVHLAEFSPKL